MISVVVETSNLGGGAPPELEALMRSLAPQVEAAGAEVVITCVSIDAAERARLEAALGRSITWVPLAAAADYYEHKNRGFDASSGSVVAFIDGDCSPVPGWLEALTAPITGGGAAVVAGVTRYPGALARLASAVDFPLFAAGPEAVRNFFANNVAFERQVFAARRYPAIEPMYHGQCQVLGLSLLADGVEIRLAPGARVAHAWPAGPREWLEVRLLRGADGRSLLPYVAETYAPRAARVINPLAPLVALALLAARGAGAGWAALRRRPRLAGLGFVACVTALDSVGAAAAPLVYYALRPRSSLRRHSPARSRA